MVAVPETCISAPGVPIVSDRPVVPVHQRRVVAVAASAMELLRPESDLARLVESFEHIDLLLASEDVPASGPGTLGVLGASADQLVDDDDDDSGSGQDPAADEVREGITQLGLDGVHLHRLHLRAPLSAGAEHDLMAAMSELVGFDPEPGVYCLAPAPSLVDPGRVAVNRAAQRIARVYGIPLLRYRCLELSVVGE